MPTPATLIIPQYQRVELTRSCVASLRAHEAEVWPIVVVDDGSSFAERSLQRATWPSGVRFVSQRHRGITAAWNTGIRLADSRFVVLVNNDVQWQGPVIDALLAPLERGDVLLTGYRSRRERWWPDHSSQPRPEDPLLDGSCWAFARETWRAVGGFDESLALYFSDTDFQARVWQWWRSGAASARAAWEVVSVPLSHAGHQSTRHLADRRQQWRRDRCRFQEKWS